MGALVTGQDEIERNLNNAIKGIIKNNALGVRTAGIFIKGESQKLTSIDEGNLIRTAFSKDIGDDENPTAVVGYTADYAGFVHEMPEDTNWNRAGAENKFLEKAVVRNLKSIVDIIARIAGRSPI